MSFPEIFRDRATASNQTALDGGRGQGRMSAGAVVGEHAEVVAPSRSTSAGIDLSGVPAWERFAALHNRLKGTTLTTDFDLLFAYNADLRYGPQLSWEFDRNAERDEKLYCSKWGVQPRDVRMFVALRQSKLLRSAFTFKYQEQPRLDRFDDFAHQIADVIEPFDETDFEPLEARLSAFVREYLPSGTAVSDPRERWDGETTFVSLSHPAVPGTTCELLLNDTVDEENILEAAQEAIENWWYSLFGEGDLLKVAGMNADERLKGVERFLFSADLADAYGRICLEVDEILERRSAQRLGKVSRD